MGLVKYQIATAQTGTIAGTGQIVVPVSGRIVGVVFRWRCTGGAAAGFYSVELAHNNPAQGYAETQNPIRTSSVAAATFYAPASSGWSSISPWIPSNWKLSAGDIINLNITQTGTAAASCLNACDIYVEE